jgi:uncharacterized protein (DUF302 family)
MPEPIYGMTRELPGVDYTEAVTRTVEALKTEGFGVLTEIDVKATLKKKLDVDFRRYVILGTCNPPIAHQALEAEPFLGLILPCNVVVMEDEAGTGSIVSLVNPAEMFQVVDNAAMADLVVEVDGRLRRVLERI